MGLWTDAEEGQTTLSSPGWHLYEVVGVMRGKRDGSSFTSKKGDPQLLVILEDDEGDGATTMFTLSERALWSFAKFLSRTGISLPALDAQGVGIDDWENESFAKERLVGRKAWAFCEHEEGGGGKTYTRLNFAHEQEVPAEEVMRRKGKAEPDPEPVPGTDDDSIPF